MKRLLDITSDLRKFPSPRLMTHIVAGFPDFATNLKCVEQMEASGVDIIEVQIPFSDPMADGSTIMKANQVALDHGFSLEKIFQFLKEMRKSLSVPILVMTYYNLPFRMGLENFFEKLEKLNLTGMIIPDIPFDEEKENFVKRAQAYNLINVLVVSPGISEERLVAIGQAASGMIYTTLRVGVTGMKSSITDSSIEFLKFLKERVSLPVAAGFGISSPEQIVQIKDYVDFTVIGSKIIRFFEEYKKEEAIKRMADFIKSCKQV